jgi:hypothetical protein
MHGHEPPGYTRLTGLPEVVLMRTISLLPSGASIQIEPRPNAAFRSLKEPGICAEPDALAARDERKGRAEVASETASGGD